MNRLDACYIATSQSLVISQEMGAYCTNNIEEHPQKEQTTWTVCNTLTKIFFGFGAKSSTNPERW